MKRNIANLIMFQIGWFACVLGAAYGFPMLGSISVLVLVVVHLIYNRDRIQETSLLFVCGVIGFVWESLLATAGIIQYTDQHMLTSAPLWMAALWVNFATTINYSLSWFKQHLMLASLGAMLSAPLAYYAGARLGAMQLPDLWLSLAVIGLGWAVLFPLLCKLADVFTICATKTHSNRQVEHHVR